MIASLRGVSAGRTSPAAPDDYSSTARESVFAIPGLRPEAYAQESLRSRSPAENQASGRPFLLLLRLVDRHSRLRLRRLLGQISLCQPHGQLPYPRNYSHPLGHGNGAASIKNVEQVRAFQAKVERSQ